MMENPIMTQIRIMNQKYKIMNQMERSQIGIMNQNAILMMKLIPK